MWFLWTPVMTDLCSLQRRQKCAAVSRYYCAGEKTCSLFCVDLFLQTSSWNFVVWHFIFELMLWPCFGVLVIMFWSCTWTKVLWSFFSYSWTTVLWCFGAVCNVLSSVFKYWHPLQNTFFFVNIAALVFLLFFSLIFPEAR